MFLVVKTGNTMKDLALNYGDFEDWMIRFMGVMRQNVMVVDVQKENLPDSFDFYGILITGAHEMVTDRHDWSERTAEWLRRAVEKSVPVMGVCYGHQLLAHALGGTVDNHPKGPEIGTVDVNLTAEAKKDPVFKSLPQTFRVHVSHTQSALTLPEGAVVLANNPYEPHHAFRYGKNAWGVQFHPEYDALISREYVLNQKEKLKSPELTLGGVEETPEANSLLGKFCEYCVK
ncbi:glutamine amidotransferase [Seleniivibrio woodruffii]|uniref:glutamine amidotransferase n=1 Tax=Seleniivibrio woodruffii TaxID=1078050 RepID=UPI002409F1A8|nr:glutamine amidotransferase [Seleniivibrio woodruffii]